MSSDVYMSNISGPILSIEKLSHKYGDRLALDGIEFSVDRGETFALLGPNGGGKTTLFRVLATMLVPSAGRASILEMDVTSEALSIRSSMGVVFQHPSLDKKLTVQENLHHQGHLYGMSSASLEDQIGELLSHFGLVDRSGETVENLSGGLQRRVELAKSLLHSPQILLMDEPTTGLDPAARLDFWNFLDQVKASRELTILFTTHFMEEADRSDRLAILDVGQLVAVGSPTDLKGQVGGDVISIGTADPEDLGTKIQGKFEVEATVIDGQIRIELPNGHEFIPALIEAYPGLIETVTLGKPTLEDVFIQLTGHRLSTTDDTTSRPEGERHRR